MNSRTNIAVSAGQFEKQLQIIRNRWNPVSLQDVERACSQNESLPDYSVLITFDDGFRNNYTLAAPLLKKYEVPAIVFLTTNLIGNNELLWPQEVRERIIDGSGEAIPSVLEESLIPLPAKLSERELLADQIVQQCKRLTHNIRTGYLEILRVAMKLSLDEPWKKELYEFLSWDEVRAIREYGVDLGAHTVSHPILSSLSMESLRDELRLCKKKIESEISEECFSLAYPNGGKADFNETVVEEVKQAGFKIAFNLCERRNPEILDSLSIDRFCITRDLSMLEFEKLLG